MADLQILEGTGKELLPQLEQYPEIRFRLTPLPAELQEPITEPQQPIPPKVLKGHGILKGFGTMEDFLRRKREDLEWEERNSQPVPQTKLEDNPQTTPVKRSRSYGILKGLTSSEDFMRRKQEEIELEERKFR